MTELQKARLQWLDAESRVLKLQKQVADLQKQIFDLHGHLLQAGIRTYTESMAAFTRGVMATTAQGKGTAP